jgi:hypothetical protein
MEFTFEQLPKAVTLLINKVDNLERLLLDKNIESYQSSDRWLDLNELCAYLPDKPVKETVYGWVHNSLIPCHKRDGQKKLFFLKSEIDQWLKAGRKKTLTEIANEVDSYLKKPGKSKKKSETNEE